PFLTMEGMDAFVRAFEAEILDGLTGEKYQNAIEALEKALPRGVEEIAPYLNRKVSKEEFDREVEKYKKTVRAHSSEPVKDCSNWEDLDPVPTTLKYAMKVLDSFIRGDNVLIEGLPAISKSAIPRWLGKLLGQEVIEVTGSPDHESAQMVGM